MPLCFNLFGSFDDPDAAAQVLAPNPRLAAEVDEIEVEWTPEAKAYKR